MPVLARRLLLACAVTASLTGSAMNAEAIMVEHLGRFIDECTLPGETRADGVVPRHANALQMSVDRWLIVYSTHGYRGVDDERSIVFQIRAERPDGPLVREGFLSRGREGWFPDDFDRSRLGPDQTVYKQHGHMVAFGAPRGAKIDGRSPPHAGLFVVKWRTAGRILNRKTRYLEHRQAGPNDGRIGQGVEWIQFRLNDAGDDLKIVQPVRPLRQAGFEQGPRFTAADDVAWMNQTFCPAVPFNADASEWADVNHIDGHRLAPMKYRYDAMRDAYVWTEIGPRIGGEGDLLHEASLVRFGDQWLIASRQPRRSGAAWLASRDPFAAAGPAGGGPIVRPEQPACNAPLTAFRCADGVVRLFTGDSKASPHRNARDPLYMWDVDPSRGCAVSNRREIFDSVSAGLPIRKEAVPKIDFCELFPLCGSTQLVVHGVSTRGYDFPYVGRSDIPAINAAEKKASGVYYARIVYDRPPPSPWRFE